MANVVFLAHLPLLRIEADSVPFFRGDLWRMPFDAYRGITANAFDQPREYAATDPVFYRYMEDLTLPFLSPRTESDVPTMLEAKLPSTASWSLLPLVEPFLSEFVEPVWAALMLAAPATALPPPRLSTCFIEIPDRDAMFEIGGKRHNAIHTQGDADHEYLFANELALAPLGAETIARAAELAPRIEGLRKSPELSAALSALLATSAPSLSPIEELTIAVTALEALLLPEVRSGLKATFARRGASLLGANPEHASSLATTLKMLYDLRSASVHGADLRHASDTGGAVRYAFAEQLLGPAVVAMDALAREGELDAARSALDGEARHETTFARELPAAPPPSLRAPDRLLRARETRPVASSGTLPSMAAPNGTTCSWAPLIGLRSEGNLRLGETQGGVLMTLNGSEALALEEREARLDFLATLALADVSHACLFTVVRGDEFGELERNERLLLRERDLGVLALRLAGFTRFHDPELLGTFVYQRNLRWRRSSVIRQTVLRGLGHTATQVFPSDGQALTDPFVRLLYDYDANGQHQDVEHVLTMFRRTFDQRFLSQETAARLMFSTLEAMLGRFRRKDDGIQLEELVRRAARGGSAVEWFEAEGRKTRNAVAHGRFRAVEEGEHPALAELEKLLVAIVPAFLDCWMKTPARGQLRPASAFIATLSA